MSKKSFHILVLLDHSFKPNSDPRVIRTLSYIHSCGYKTALVCYAQDGLLHEDYIGDIPIFRDIPLEYSSPRSVFSIREQTAMDISEKYTFSALFCNDQRMLDLGVRIKKKKKDTLILYDAHEYFQDYQSLLEEDGSLIYKLKSRIYRNYETRKEISNGVYIDQMITISESFAELFSKDFNLKKAPIVVRNIPDLPEKQAEIQDFDNKIFLKLEELPTKDNLIYFGNFFKELNGIENVFYALQKINSEVRLIIVGDSKAPAYFENLWKDLHIEDRILHIHRLPQKYMPSISRYAKIAVVPTMKTDVLQTWLSLPNKFFDSIKVQLPIICTNLPEHARIVNQEKNGILVDGTDWEKAQKQIVSAYYEIIGNYEFFRQKAVTCDQKMHWRKEYYPVYEYLSEKIPL